MAAAEKEIFLAAIFSCLLMIALISIIIYAIVRYQNKSRSHLKDIASLKSLYDQELTKIELEVREKSFQTLAQEIHDNIGQVLSLAKLNLTKVITGNTDKERERLEDSKNLIAKAIMDLRNLAKSLNTSYIASHNLKEVLLQDLAILERTGEFQVTFSWEGHEVTLDREKQLIIYRILQEAIANIVKHAGASAITLQISNVDRHLRIRLSDNGQGFETRDATIWTGTGILNMSNRAALIGATFNIHSQKDKGTEIKIVLPINFTG